MSSTVEITHAMRNSRTAEKPQGINPRWVASILQQRGFPLLEIETLSHALEKFNGERDELRARLVRIQNGTESSQEMDAMASWVRAIKSERSDTIKNSITVSEHTSVEMAASIETPTHTRRQAKKSQRPIGETKPTPRLRESIHVYGLKGALCIEPIEIDVSDIEHRTPVVHTLLLEMAPAQSAGRYNWESKINFRLTQRELPLFVALMMGWVNGSLSFTNHGVDKDKKLELIDQGAIIFCKLSQKGRAVAVPIPVEEIFSVCAKAFNALAKNHPLIDSQTLVSIVKRVAAMHQLKAASDRR